MGNKEEMNTRTFDQIIDTLHQGVKARVKVNEELSEEYEIKVGIMYQRYVLPPFLLANVVDVVTELGREDVITELLYADDLLIMNKTTGGHRNKYGKSSREQGFESYP